MKAFKILLTIAAVFFLMTFMAEAQSTSEKYDEYWVIFVDCDGVEDYLYGNISLHCIWHPDKSGNCDWEKDQYKGIELTSRATGEVFRVSFIMKAEISALGKVIQLTRHYNLTGNSGTHILYSVTLLADWTGGYLVETVIKEKAKCF